MDRTEFFKFFPLYVLAILPNKNTASLSDFFINLQS